MSTSAHLQYIGYQGSFEFDSVAALFHGEVQLDGDVVTFQSETLEGLSSAFTASIDDYLEFCRQRGEEPTAPKRATK